MIARDPDVAAALLDLRAITVDGDDHDTGWMLALGHHRDLVDTIEHGALRRLALSLAAGDLDGARRAARWFTDPAGAMEHALACIRAEHALDREVSL